MTNLANLLQVHGVVAALRFLDDGSLTESVGEFDPAYASLAAEMCYANGRIMFQGGEIFTALSDMPGWTPSQGWIMVGDKLSVCTIAEVACFVKNGESSFNEVLKALSEIAHQ